MKPRPSLSQTSTYISLCQVIFKPLTECTISSAQYLISLNTTQHKTQQYVETVLTNVHNETESQIVSRFLLVTALVLTLLLNRLASFLLRSLLALLFQQVLLQLCHLPHDVCALPPQCHVLLEVLLLPEPLLQHTLYLFLIHCMRMILP